MFYFVVNLYWVSLLENIKVGFKVLRVFVEDLDDVNNGQILYDFIYINKREFMFFFIDKYIGWIIIVVLFNCEFLDFFVLSVCVIDRGEVIQMLGYIVVYVIVLDVNDFLLKFFQEIFEFFVCEDVLIG